MNPRDKVAIVTGGASGLGRAVAQALHDAGASVVLFDRNAELGTQAAAELGQRALFAQVDVTSEEQVQAGLDAAMARFGAVHICVNCAGVPDAAKTVSDGKPFPLAVWQKVIAINLTGTFNVLRLAAVLMARNTPEGEERGVIVNLSSGAAHDGQMGQAAYAASKAGVIGLTLPVARDLAEHGIRCVAVAPGLFDTPMVAGLPKKVAQAIVDRMVLFPPRMGRPAELAHLVRSVVENPYINATCLHIDAGARMSAR
ncbi:MAG: SDR family NAD(P)-dependent oxidoreductase [Burkholderiales bacterium]|jgi:3-hydroxyacyl-CoA dehydrogenase/3-hydroxy-2-methylbutyryl-CoA dehydrogenase|uniref:SDR family NAD(P)-dependent oxidoreductase n=1 Tax=Ottowia sp. VDI28 TaxID=3133968 RepID=UPI00092A3201|nr:SDR family NAD(P)-dependent oxidoreductase [Burkholderiales bacterium]OJX34172.1 MAG: 3-hydroxyacyl-CoA dehydrogenase [Burkholderiales bacterium 68-12]